MTTGSQPPLPGVSSLCSAISDLRMRSLPRQQGRGSAQSRHVGFYGGSLNGPWWIFRQEDDSEWAGLDRCPWEHSLSEGQYVLEKGTWGLGTMEVGLKERQGLFHGWFCRKLKRTSISGKGAVHCTAMLGFCQKTRPALPLALRVKCYYPIYQIRKWRLRGQFSTHGHKMKESVLNPQLSGCRCVVAKSWACHSRCQGTVLWGRGWPRSLASPFVDVLVALHSSFSQIGESL